VSIEKVTELAPDCDDFSTFFTSLAGDTVASLVYTAEAYLVEDASEDRLRLVLQVMEGSIYEYLSVVNDPVVGVHAGDPPFEESIFQFPLMVAELAKQQEDLAYLRNNPQLSEHELLHLKSSSSRSGIQPVERGLVTQFSS
jgi:hypothetical protein